MPGRSQQADCSVVHWAPGPSAIAPVIGKEWLDKKILRSLITTRLLLTIVAGLSLSLVGCSDNGPARVPVSGKVTLNGKPLSWGSIMFVPEGGTSGPKSGAEVINGEFTVDRKNGPVVGKLRVQIRNDRHQETLATQEALPIVPPSDNKESEPPIPPRYNHHSELVIETSASEDNYFEFELTSDPPETD